MGCKYWEEELGIRQMSGFRKSILGMIIQHDDSG
jgi:hypothetical protein